MFFMDLDQENICWKSKIKKVEFSMCHTQIFLINKSTLPKLRLRNEILSLLKSWLKNNAFRC